MKLLSFILNELSHALGIDLEFDAFGVFLFIVVVIVPVVSMVGFARMARRYQRPVALVALVPVVVWVIPTLSFWLRSVWEIKPLPLLGIALGCAGWMGLFVWAGGNRMMKEGQDTRQH